MNKNFIYNEEVDWVIHRAYEDWDWFITEIVKDWKVEYWEKYKYDSKWIMVCINSDWWVTNRIKKNDKFVFKSNF